MPQDDRGLFDLASAEVAAEQGRIGAWVQAYLRTGTWANLGLAEGLLAAPRWWAGPFEAELDDLGRTCGPEPDMLFQQEAGGWERSVDALAAGLDRLRDLPPLIVEGRPDGWYLADGNHRHEALRRSGFSTCWLVAWFNDVADLRAFQGPGISSSAPPAPRATASGEQRSRPPRADATAAVVPLRDDGKSSPQRDARPRPDL